MARVVNARLSREKFVVEPDSGLLKFEVAISWSEFQMAADKFKRIREQFHYIFCELNDYIDLANFCEPAH